VTQPQYASSDGVHVYSSALRADAPQLERELAANGFRYAASASTFVTVDAPACPLSKTP
jgi:hypothetical protein